MTEDVTSLAGMAEKLGLNKFGVEEALEFVKEEVRLKETNEASLELFRASDNQTLHTIANLLSMSDS